MPIHPRAQEAAPKILDVIDMLNRLSATLFELGDPDELTANLLLEGFLIRARILYDFLIGKPIPYTKSPLKGDYASKGDYDSQREMFAVDYLKRIGKWEKDRKLRCPYLRTHAERLGRVVPRLTYKRRDVQAEAPQRCYPDRISRELMDAWRVFLTHLDSETRQWFDAKNQ